MRGEFVDWFRPRPGTAAPGAERYDFFASQLRAGLSVVLPHAYTISDESSLMTCPVRTHQLMIQPLTEFLATPREAYVSSEPEMRNRITCALRVGP